MRDRRRVVGWLLGALAATLVVLPLLTLVLRAFADEWRSPAIWPQRIGNRGFEYAFSDAAGAGGALRNSLIVAGLSTLLALVISWPAARAIGERRLKRPGPLLVLLALPLLVPPYATGAGLAEWFIRFGLADSLTGLVVAHLVPVLPYVALILASGFGPRVRDLEEAAGVLGAGPVRRFVVITVPAVLPTLAAAALLGFLVSWSQYGLSLAVGGGLPMLPIVLLPFISSDPQVGAALSILFLLPAIAALAVAAWASVRAREGEDPQAARGAVRRAPAVLPPG